MVSFTLQPLCFPWKGSLVCTEFEVVSDSDGLNPVEKGKNLVILPGIECPLFGRSARSVVITPTNKDNNVTIAMFIQVIALLLHLHKLSPTPPKKIQKKATCRNIQGCVISLWAVLNATAQK